MFVLLLFKDSTSTEALRYAAHALKCLCLICGQRSMNFILRKKKYTRVCACFHVRHNTIAGEAYFSNYIAYVTSYGAENVELHRNIDGYVLLMSDIDLASDEELYSFASFFLGHSNLMHDLFHILKKSQNDDLITEYCGQGNTDGINATYFKRRMTDRVRPEFRLMIESGSSVGRRVKKAEKSPVFLLLLVRPLSPAFNEVLFSQDVYTANYFNTYPEFRAPPM